jgi:hypothetical protein
MSRASTEEMSSMNANITLNQSNESVPAPGCAMNSNDHAPSEAFPEASVVRYEGPKQPRVPVGIVIAIILVLVAALYWAFKSVHNR